MGAFWGRNFYINGSSENDIFGWDIVLSSDGTRLAISDPNYDTNESRDVGYVAVYDLSKNALTNETTSDLNVEIIGDGAQDNLGFSIDFSNDANSIAIGSPGNDQNVGEVNIYARSNDEWNLKGSTISGGANNQAFGRSLSISEDGSIIAIGDPFFDSSGTNVGSTTTFKYDPIPQDWIQIGQKITGSTSYSNLGYSVDLSLNGELLAIGSPETGLTNKNGLVSIYHFQDQRWQKIGQDIIGESDSDESGTTLKVSSPSGTLDGSIIAVGAIKNDGTGKKNSGHVRVFKYSQSQNSWDQLGNDIDGTNIGDLSSYEIDLSDNGQTLSIGSIKHDLPGNDAGQVRIFNFDEEENLWRQSGFDLLGTKANENFGSSTSFSSDAKTIAISSLNGGENDYGQITLYDLTSKIYPLNDVLYSNDNALIRYHYKLIDSITGEKVTGVNLWTLDDSGNNTTFDNEYKNKSYDLVVEAKTIDNSNTWNLETFDLTLNLVDGIFSNWDTADLSFGSKVNFATSFSKIESSEFNGDYSYSKEGLRVTGAMGSELAGTQKINHEYVELFSVKGLYFDENVERGNRDGETLAIDIISNDYDTVLSNYQDTDNDGSYDNALIKSLSEFGYSDLKKSIEVDRSSEIYTYQTFADLIEHGTTLWTQREVGSNSKAFLVRNGSTVSGRSWWSNIGNFETELEDLVLSDLSSEQRYSWDGVNLDSSGNFISLDSNTQKVGTKDDFLASKTNEFLNSDNSNITYKLSLDNFSEGLTRGFANLQINDSFSNNLTLIEYSNPTNLSSFGENTVMGFSVNGVSSDGKASSWDDSTSESFYVDLKVKVSGDEGESINQESFYSISGNDFKDNLKVSNNSNLLSKNIITFQGDLNYDGRVSLIDLAYLNAAKIYADNNSYIASNEVDANFDGEISVEDISIIEKDFLKNIHGSINHNEDSFGNYLNWDSQQWVVPVIEDSEISHLNVGTISELDTFIEFDNASFIKQQNLENSGLLDSVSITAFINE